MKSKLSIAALCCFVSVICLCYGQERKADIPVVIDTKKDYGQGKSRICLSYPGIEDTLIVRPYIRVDFYTIRLLSHRKDPKVFRFLYDRNKINS